MSTIQNSNRLFIHGDVSIFLKPSKSPGSTITFHGYFELLSLTAMILPVGCDVVQSSGGGFWVSVAEPQGQMVGGLVVGLLVAAGTFYIIAVTLNSPSFHRLGGLEHDVAGEGVGGREVSPHSAVFGTEDGDFCGNQAGSDVI